MHPVGGLGLSQLQRGHWKKGSGHGGRCWDSWGPAPRATPGHPWGSFFWGGGGEAEQQCGETEAGRWVGTGWRPRPLHVSAQGIGLGAAGAGIRALGAGLGEDPGAGGGGGSRPQPPVSPALGGLGGAQRSCTGQEVSLEAFGGARKAEYRSLACAQALGDGCWSWAWPAALPSRGRPSASERAAVSPHGDPPVAGPAAPWGARTPVTGQRRCLAVRDTGAGGGTAAAGAVCPPRAQPAARDLPSAELGTNREKPGAAFRVEAGGRD